MKVDYNRDIRQVLKTHMEIGTWQILDDESNMEIRGLLKATHVHIHLRGPRTKVLEVMEALVRTLVDTERLPG